MSFQIKKVTCCRSRSITISNAFYRVFCKAYRILQTFKIFFLYFVLVSGIAYKRITVYFLIFEHPLEVTENYITSLPTKSKRNLLSPR